MREPRDGVMDTRVEEDVLTCGHCGYRGPDVEIQNRYIGGFGLVASPYCKDSMACWRRWNAENL